ncbi:uncharacterized protein LOC130904496 isoform X2 [Corythoichthys intestinalis]|uniref:uncharacterized protein LOC130904496 isoform X2 n=1 Tax=Corythoichthys intestinalis TaxID=161448 RepID=UPI0025A606FB|nr:uncharacterized protein LOC130904496 isoform X2 [Corythoichthys intestinalis]
MMFVNQSVTYNFMLTYLSIVENKEFITFVEDCVVGTLKRKASSNGAQRAKMRCDVILNASEHQEVEDDSALVRQTVWKAKSKAENLTKKQNWSGNPVPAKGRRRMLNTKTGLRGGQTEGHGKGTQSRKSTRKPNSKPETQTDCSKTSKQSKTTCNAEPKSCTKKNQRSNKTEKCPKKVKKTRGKSAKETNKRTTKLKGKLTRTIVKAVLAKGTRRNACTNTKTRLKKLRFKRNEGTEKFAPSQGSKRNLSTKPETFTKKMDKQPEAQLTRAKPKSNEELGPLGEKPSIPGEGVVKPKTKCIRKPQTFMKKTKLSHKDALIQRARSSKTRVILTKNPRGKTAKASLKITPAKETNRKSNTTLETLSKKPNKIPTEMFVVFFGDLKKDTITEKLPLRKCNNIPLRFKGSSPYHQAATNRALFAQKYQQVNKLGEGGFGSVYAGYRKSDCFPVAIKYIPKEVKSVPLNINGLKKDIPIEALLMLQASIKKNSDGKSAVVSLLNKYDLEHQIVLVMERPVPSVDLFTYITRCRLGALLECEAKNIMKQLVVAAINMHAVDVFHRDLKQENILLEATSGVPRVRIIDFGCSCLASNEPYRDYNGTLCYAPPEYVLRRTYSAGPTTVWHLGALLFELMAGTKRFDTVMFLSQMLRLNRVLSEECEDFLWKCLNLDPEKRATLEQMQEHPWLI